MQVADGDKVLVEIIVGIKKALDDGRLRLKGLQDFVLTFLFERDNNLVVVHAEFRRRFGAVMDSKDPFGLRAATDFLFLSRHHNPRYRMVGARRQLPDQFRPGHYIAFLLRGVGLVRCQGQGKQRAK